MNTRSVSLLVLMAAGLLLSGCSVESQSWVNESRVEVKADNFTDTFETESLGAQALDAIAAYYARFGNGEMSLVVSYNPQSRSNTKAKAESALMRIKKALESKGVTPIGAALTSLRNDNDVSMTLISFPALVASAPSGCGQLMPGYKLSSVDVQSNATDKPDYRIGCTIETLMAKQIAHPSDLMGRQGLETDGDGRRVEKVISSRGYYSDTANTPLNGEKASAE